MTRNTLVRSRFDLQNAIGRDAGPTVNCLALNAQDVCKFRRTADNLGG